MATLELEVVEVKAATPEVCTFTLADPQRGPLPSFTPGSHVMVECGTAINAYSLVGESTLPDSYMISVLKLPDGSGGSRWLHERKPGDTVTVRPPRSLFAPAQKARKHLLIAGGIGITPILSHARSAARWNQPMEVLYAHRGGHGAHLDELRELAPESLSTFTERGSFLTALEKTLTQQPMGTHLYCCGPEPFMDVVCRTAQACGWPDSRVHTERFGADALDPGKPFDTVLTKSGITVNVPAGASMLEVLESRGIAVPSLCRQGFCGECRIPVTKGRPLHRDHYLEDSEQEADDSIMCCVSRARTPSLEVPL